MEALLLRHRRQSADAGDHWQRLGTAWTKKDESINIVLNALPLNGKLHLREPKASEASNG